MDAATDAEIARLLVSTYLIPENTLHPECSPFRGTPPALLFFLEVITQPLFHITTSFGAIKSKTSL